MEPIKISSHQDGLSPHRRKSFSAGEPNARAAPRYDSLLSVQHIQAFVSFC
jgi:hypothetical protein